MPRKKARLSQIEDLLKDLCANKYWNLIDCDSPDSKQANRKIIFKDRTYGNCVTIEVNKNPERNSLIWPYADFPDKYFYGIDEFKSLAKLLRYEDFDILYMLSLYRLFYSDINNKAEQNKAEKREQRKKYQKEYSRRPEVIEHRRAYQRARYQKKKAERLAGAAAV